MRSRSAGSNAVACDVFPVLHPVLNLYLRVVCVKQHEIRRSNNIWQLFSERVGKKKRRQMHQRQKLEMKVVI